MPYLQDYWTGENPISLSSVVLLIFLGVLLTVAGGGMAGPGQLPFLGFVAIVIRFGDGFGIGMLFKRRKWIKEAHWVPICIGMAVYIAGPITSDWRGGLGLLGTFLFIVALPTCFLSMIGLLGVISRFSPNSIVDTGICIIIACSFLVGPDNADGFHRLIFFSAFPGGIAVGLLVRQKFFPDSLERPASAG